MPNVDLVVEHDAATGETVIRGFTHDEMAQKEADQAAAEADRRAGEAVNAARKAARDSAVARFRALGFTDTEIEALVLPN